MPEKPGDETDALDQTAEEVDAEIAAGRQQEIAAAAPVASEPLDPARVNPLAQIVADAAAELSGGEISVAPAEVAEPVDQVPPELFAQLMAISGLTEQGVPELEKYAFDPTELGATNAGLAEMANTISAMAGDKKVVQAMNRPLPEGGGPPVPEPAPEPAPESPNLEGLL